MASDVVAFFVVIALIAGPNLIAMECVAIREKTHIWHKDYWKES